METSRHFEAPVSPTETELTPELKERIREKLLEEEGRLTSALGSFAHPNPRSPNDFEADFPNLGSDDDENASEVTIFTENKAIEGPLEMELRDTRQALLRLEKGEYGFCKYCKQPIKVKRLLARPASSSCIACKEQRQANA